MFNLVKEHTNMQGNKVIIMIVYDIRLYHIQNC